MVVSYVLPEEVDRSPGHKHRQEPLPRRIPPLYGDSIEPNEDTVREDAEEIDPLDPLGLDDPLEDLE